MVNMQKIDKRKLEWPYQCMQSRFKTKESQFLVPKESVHQKYMTVLDIMQLITDRK